MDAWRGGYGHRLAEATNGWVLSDVREFAALAGLRRYERLRTPTNARWAGYERTHAQEPTGSKDT